MSAPPEVLAWYSKIGKIGAEVSWGNTENRSARTAPARAAHEAKFLEQAGGDPVRAAHLRKAHYQRMALKSAKVRASRKTVPERTDSDPRPAA
jgi:hypothetical protein